MRYTFYVFLPEVTEFDQVFVPGNLTGANAYEVVELRNVTFDARAYLQRNRPSTPGWLEFVAGFCDLPSPQTIRNRSNSFVLAVRTTNGAMCALTYGLGFLALNREKVKKDFGLEAACRLLNPASIKEVESKAAGADGLHKLQIASKAGDLATFPIQRTRDHVHRLGGNSPDEELGKRITGATSCTIGGTLRFSRIGEVCERLVASLTLRPNARLAALRPFEPVQEQATVAALERKLLDALRPNRCKDIGLYLPEAEDWRSIEQFEFTCDGDHWNALDDLDIQAIVGQARAAVGNALNLQELRLRGLSQDGQTVLDQRLADLAAFDTQYRNRPYALKDGRWFLLNQRYVAQRNLEMQNIEVESDAAYLPAWAAGPSEYDFNTGVASANAARFLCLDQDLVDTDDGGSVEACDLLTVDGHFIHVKNWSSSQTFSALMKQGENAAVLLESSQEFRDGLFEKLPATWKNMSLWRKLSAGIPSRDLRIVFAIAADSTRAVPASLPFFSRMSLLDTCASLRARYFNVRVFHIPRQRPRTRRRRT